MIHLAARGISAGWEPATGHLPHLRINQTDILHCTPWREDPAIQSDPEIPLVDRRLGGTFVCAPFGQNDEGPPHGETANAPWSTRRSSPSALVATRQFPRGRVTAQVTLRDGHPVLYQTHTLDLTAPCTFAHHPMVALAGAGRLSTSTPAKVLTFQAPTIDGTALYVPNQSSDGFMIETATGPRDLLDYPDTPCDDFVALIHEPGLVWTAIARAEERDTIVMLKRAEQLPLTGLWFSNGARQDAPWNGRAGVLGIEDARCAGADGFAAALSGETAVPAPTVFPAGRRIVPHAIVHLRGCHTIIGTHIQAERLTFETKTSPVTIPFDGSHFS